MEHDGDYEHKAGSASLYVNYFELAHSRHEFLLTLGQYRPGHAPSDGRVMLHTWLAVSPPYALMLSKALAAAIADHERDHGPIDRLASGPPDDAWTDVTQNASSSAPDVPVRAEERAANETTPPAAPAAHRANDR